MPLTQSMYSWPSTSQKRAPLARLEGRLVFETLLRRLPNLRLDGRPPEYRANFNLRGLKSLEVSC